MGKFNVTLTLIHNASVEIEATNEEEARQLVHNDLDKYAPDSIFSRGEKTVDYAELVE